MTLRLEPKDLEASTYSTWATPPYPEAGQGLGGRDRRGVERGESPGGTTPGNHEWIGQRARAPEETGA